MGFQTGPNLPLRSRLHLGRNETEGSLRPFLPGDDSGVTVSLRAIRQPAESEAISTHAEIASVVARHDIVEPVLASISPSVPTVTLEKGELLKS